MSGPTPHPQREALIELFKTYKSRGHCSSYGELYKQLNISHSELTAKGIGEAQLKKRLSNLMSSAGSCSHDLAQLFLLHSGNLVWNGDPTIENLYRQLIHPHLRSDILTSTFQKFVLADGDEGHFDERLLGAYLVYRASDESAEPERRIVRSLLNIRSLRGREGMTYSFFRMHGPNAGIHAKGAVLAQSGRFTFLGASQTRSGRNEGGITLMSLSVMISKATGKVGSGDFRYMQGLHLMATDFADAAVATKVVALKSDQHRGVLTESVREELSRDLSVKEACREISALTGYDEEKLAMDGGPLSNTLTQRQHVLKTSHRPPVRD